MTTNEQTAAGVTIPDTKLANETTALMRDATSDLIYHHSRRVFWWVSLQARNRGLSYDPELLYIAAMFHDVGLNAEYLHTARRFEVESADHARRFLQSHGVPDDSIRRVWTAIALHTTPGIPEFMEPEVALVTACGVRRARHWLPRHQRCGPSRGHRLAPPAGLQAPDPRGVHRRLRSQAGHHVRHPQRRRLGTIRSWFRTRQLRGHHREL